MSAGLTGGASFGGTTNRRSLGRRTLPEGAPLVGEVVCSVTVHAPCPRPGHGARRFARAPHHSSLLVALREPPRPAARPRPRHNRPLSLGRTPDLGYGHSWSEAGPARNRR